MPSAIVYRQICHGHVNGPKLTSASSYPTTNTDGKRGFSDGRVDHAVQFASADVFGIFTASPTNSRRRDFVVTAPVTSGSLLPTHVGPVGAVRVDGKPGKLCSADMVQWLIDNALSLTERQGYYAIDADRILFVGTSATVDVVQLPDPVDPSLIPVEYANAVVAIALSYLFAFEGENLGAAQHYAQIADRYRLMIASSRELPEVPPYEPR